MFKTVIAWLKRTTVTLDNIILYGDLNCYINVNDKSSVGSLKIFLETFFFKNG